MTPKWLAGFLLSLAVLSSCAPLAWAQTTAFTYQGRLFDSGNPTNGSYDLIFAVFNAPTPFSPGQQLGPTITNTAVGVSNGLFTVTLDFGPGIFTGADRWLQIGVRPSGPGSFAALSPLQKLAPTPYAIFAAGAGNVAASNLTGTLPDAQLSTNVVLLNSSPNFTAINGTSLALGSSNLVAPLTILPHASGAAVGTFSTGTNSFPLSVALSGQYACVIAEGSNALQIFDVSNPTNPVKVASATTHNIPVSVAVAGRYAYVACDFFLQIFDLANSNGPVSMGSAPLMGGKQVLVSGRFAYVACTGGNDTDPSIDIFDVGNPNQPFLIHSLQLFNAPTSIALADPCLYVTDGAFLQIFYFLLNPEDFATTRISLTPMPNSGAIAVAGRYAYIGTFDNVLRVIDVYHPQAPVQVGSVAMAPNTNGSEPSLALSGRYAYVADGNNSLQIFDISNPSAPVPAGSLPTGNGPVSVALAGRYAYVPNIVDGSFQVFDVGGAFIGQLEAGALQTGTLRTRNDASVGNNLDVRGGLVVAGSARIDQSLSINYGEPFISNYSNSYPLVVNGVAAASSFLSLSDARYKTNIAPISHPLDKLMGLQGVEFDWRRAEYPQLKFGEGPQLGFVAQQTKEILPEVVSKDAGGYYSIAYDKVIPVVVEAVKEQQQKMENALKEKDARISDLEKRLADLERNMRILADTNSALRR